LTSSQYSQELPASPTVLAPRSADEVFLSAALPWYGLDDQWRGPRQLGSVSTGSDGCVEYGLLGHGEPPSGRPTLEEGSARKSAAVLTMALLPRRTEQRPDGAAGASLEATSVETAAAVAGLRLVEEQWPRQLDPAVRHEWLLQQRDLACEVAERLGDPPWRLLTLPLDGAPHVFHYRESQYGWVLAATAPLRVPARPGASAVGDFLVAAYGRGVSAYGLGLARADLARYL
jgi:hypothetical protein